MKKRNFIRIICIVLCVAFMCAAFVGCGNKKGKTLMSIGKHTISVNMYELFMTRYKANLAYAGSNVTSDAFWNTIADKETQSTYDTYFQSKVFESCKTYLVVLYLFEEEGLKLSDAVVKEIDKKLKEFVEYDGDGSKNAFNSLIADYGVNYNILREVYLLEAKYDALITHYYGKDASQISPEVKNDFLRDNYYCFKQCFLPYYYYVYETDKDGNVVYYNKNTNQYAYDTENGERKTDDDGKYIKDKFGNDVYYKEDGSVAYDEKNGMRVEIDENKDDKCDTEYYDKDKQNEILKQAEELTKQAQDMNMSLSLFGALIDEYSSADDKFEYLQSSTSYAYDYVANIAKALGKAKEGDVVMVESEYGCHIIMKCEPEDNAYEKDEYKGVFSEFSSYIMKQLLEERCKPHYDKIKIDDKVMALVPSFKEVNTNYYY